MDTFRAHQADILDPAQEPRVLELLRQHGLVTFTGITDRAALAKVAHRLMSIRPHRDAGPDGATEITDTGIGTTGPGRARIRLRLDDLAMFSADATPSSQFWVP